MTTEPSFLLIDKDGGWTSHDVVARVRRIFGLRKVGHAGTLDPMATGLVVVAMGRATRLLRFVQGQAKEYVATACFGVATDSLDADGAILDRTPMAVEQADVERALGRFVGDIMQVPPMVSAVQIGGRRLYELAREGKEVERPARPVTIHRIDLEAFAPGPYPEVTLRVVCGTGTYIRTLADDIAQALGGRAHLTALRRVRNGSLEVRTAWRIDDLEALATEGRLDEAVLHPLQALGGLPIRELATPLVEQARNGRRIPVGTLEVAQNQHVMAVAEGILVGVYRVVGSELVPEVVLT